MDTFIKNIKEWQDLFKELEKIKKINGSNIIRKTMEAVKNLENKELSFFNGETTILNTLFVYGITSLDKIYMFLDAIKDIYSFDNIIKQLTNIKEKYGIDKLAFIYKGTNSQKYIDTYFNNLGMKKVYFSLVSDGRKIINFKSNNLYTCLIYIDKDFIVEIKDFIDFSKNERILYTYDFRFNLNNIPSKEELNIININSERDYLFQVILDSLQQYDIKLIVGNPNIEKDNIININDYETFHTDGIIFDENKNILKPNKGIYVSNKIIIENAQFVVIANIVANNLNNINIVISPRYYKHVIDNLELGNKKVDFYKFI